MTKQCKHYLVIGKVQGVFYRDSTRRKAQELSITGWVQNTSEGHVEVIACGEPDALETFEQWLWQGPDAAHVTDIQSADSQNEAYEDFVIKR